MHTITDAQLTHTLEVAAAGGIARRKDIVNYLQVGLVSCNPVRTGGKSTFYTYANHVPSIKSTPPPSPPRHRMCVFFPYKIVFSICRYLPQTVSADSSILEMYKLYGHETEWHGHCTALIMSKPGRQDGMPWHRTRYDRHCVNVILKMIYIKQENRNESKQMLFKAKVSCSPVRDVADSSEPSWDPDNNTTSTPKTFKYANFTTNIFSFFSTPPRYTHN